MTQRRWSLKTMVLGSAAGLLSLAMSVGGPATAQPQGFQQYVCSVNTDGELGWLPPQALVFVGQGGDAVMVYDGIIAASNDEELMEADVRRKTGTAVTFSYVLRVTTSNQQRVRVRYTGTIDTATRAYQLEADLSGTRQRQFSRGRCEPRRS